MVYELSCKRCGRTFYACSQIRCYCSRECEIEDFKEYKQIEYNILIPRKHKQLKQLSRSLTKEIKEYFNENFNTNSTYFNLSKFKSPDIKKFPPRAYWTAEKQCRRCIHRRLCDLKYCMYDDSEMIIK